MIRSKSSRIYQYIQWYLQQFWILVCTRVWPVEAVYCLQLVDFALSTFILEFIPIFFRTLSAHEESTLKSLKHKYVGEDSQQPAKKKKKPKNPNPLSCKKSKKKLPQQQIEELKRKRKRHRTKKKSMPLSTIGTE